MTGPDQPDFERLAALIDGRLSEADAVQLRAELALADEDTVAAFADAVAISGEVGAMQTGRPDTPEATGRIIPFARRLRWAVPVLAAAGIAGVVVATQLSRSGSGPSPSAEWTPADIAVALGPDGARPVAVAWSATRGSDPVVTPSGRAVRMGALLVDLELAARRRDSDPSPQSAAIAALLGSSTGGDALAAQLRESVSNDAQRNEISSRAMRLVGTSLAQAGAWIEAARIAVAAGDSAFLDRPYLASALATVSRNPQLGPDERRLAEDVAGLLTRRPREMAALGRALDDLLRALTH